jgi:septum formation protein
MTSPRLIYPYPKLVLASLSPRRQSLLRQMNIAFEVSAPNIPEEVLPGEKPQDFTRRMAEEKARAVGRSLGEAWVLGADTVVVIDDRIMGIPPNEGEAKEMLERLSGRSHSVFTSFCFYRPSLDYLLVRTVESTVVFKTLTDEEIRGYIRSGEPSDKAGAYGAQGLGAFMIREIHGSYTNVVGLPLCEVVEAMKELKIIKEFP